jgi:HD-GYP domain-containing protein (c-di-GMP phosphodiesterase class II)
MPAQLYASGRHAFSGRELAWCLESRAMALMALARAIEARDPYSSGHAARVTAIAEVIAARLGWDDEQIDVLRIGAALHDIGKLAVPDSVLRKPGPLNEAELDHVRAHPQEGAHMLGLVGTLRAAVPCVLHHHERWDGHGYPTGTAGEEIPIEARVLAVADAYDAMTSDRPYRRALTQGRAISELERCAGTQFDPDVVAVFAEAWRQGAFELPAGMRRATAS